MGNLSKTAVLFLSVALLAGGAWWVQQQGSTEVDGVVVVASVNDISITRDEFVREMARRGGKLPGQYQTVEQRRELLDLMLEKRALVEGARIAGYDRDPEIVARYEDMLARKFRQDMLNKRLETVAVSDQEVEEYYRQHKQDYARPARRQVAMVHVAVPGKASEEAWEKASGTMDNVLAAVAELPQETHHFGPVAVKYSDDRASRYRGGVIGWLVEHPGREYKWDEQVVKAAFTLRDAGEFSDVIKTEKGYYLLRLVQSQNSEVQPLEKLQDGLRNRLLTEKRREMQQQVLDEVHQGMKIVVNEPVLAAIEPISKDSKIAGQPRPPAMP